MTQSDKLAFFQHTLATLAYRGSKALEGAPEGFGEVRAAASSRSAGEILAHIGDVLDWACSIVEGKQTWAEGPVRSWEENVERFRNCLRRLQTSLSSADPAKLQLERLFQGPIADATWHLGQIALLRGLTESPVKAENYYQAGVVPIS